MKIGDLVKQATNRYPRLNNKIGIIKNIIPRSNFTNYVIIDYDNEGVLTMFSHEIKLA